VSEWKPGDKLPDAVRRPAQELHNYPVEMRWDFVRRHPFYVMYWEEVRRYYDKAVDDPPERREFGFRAKLLLGGIGVYGPPVAPASTIGEILEGSEPSLLSGSLQPMTLRMMASLLIQHLDPEAKAFLAALLLDTANRTNDAGLPREEIQRVLSAATHSMNAVALPKLDTFADAPLFFMNLNASLRMIHADAVDQAKRWKRKRGITDPPKLRKEKYSDYLKVWDLREGWTGHGYDRGKELKLREIAKRLGEPITTITSRYQQAFRLVVGVDYSPELWMQVFWPVKVHELFRPGSMNTRVGIKRRVVSAVRRPVPAADLGGHTGPNQATDPGAGGVKVIEAAPAKQENMEYRDLILDYLAMTALGRTDLEIGKGLGIEVAAVKYLRDHLEDFKGQ
jgi:hypothetical protein